MSLLNRKILLIDYNNSISLEIKKVFQKVGDTETKIELWDTNLSIINSLIVKSKFLSNKFFFFDSLLQDMSRIYLNL
jgi:hypothetical protein